MYAMPLPVNACTVFVSCLMQSEHLRIHFKDTQKLIKPYELKQRFLRCSIVSGTRSHHCFIPQSKSTLEMKTLSADEEGTKMKLFNDDRVTSIRSHEMMSSYIKIYNMENMLLACITMYDTLVL